MEFAASPENFRWTTARYLAWDARWEISAAFGIAPAAAVLIGMDTRIGRAYRQEKFGGLAAAGVSAASAGVITTPGVACLVQHGKFSAGIVISASHNPYHDNGIKLFRGFGHEIPG